ncbi:radical SAM protein [Candidatus Marinamargulisbacteria bacterium SCGC AG-410-N11]|nr:radical SAM protein [Candidatus Marinamargulisbacteria bacterium SCGC AG-410-N11]
MKSFKNQLQVHNYFPLKPNSLTNLQVNVGYLCNLTCSHCHVEAGPHRQELMSQETMDHCISFVKSHAIKTVDITGGAPEMNPHLEYFISQLAAIDCEVIVRSNLTVLAIPKYAHFLSLFAQNNVTVIASLPCYLEDNTDLQRGTHVFKKSITIIQKLNQLGYGQTNNNLKLHLVHNPTGPTLPPNQVNLEKDYKDFLLTQYNILFNQLFCITNMPIKRFLDHLKQTNQLDNYMALLIQSFNIKSLPHVMCKSTLSVGWDGQLYDCDFNQMLQLPITNNHIHNVDFNQLQQRSIIVSDHCYGCTAGSGSSCKGTLN